jgi:hypothetical protein
VVSHCDEVQHDCIANYGLSSIGMVLVNDFLIIWLGSVFVTFGLTLSFWNMVA